MKPSKFPRLDLALSPGAAVLETLVPEAGAMRACLQDSVHHAEGDVWTHTLMVADALAGARGFRDLDADTREALSWAALLHDVAKPATRQEEFDPVLGRDRVSHPHHASKGARMAWGHLWRLGAPLDLRRRVHALVLAHQRVFHVLSQPDWEDLVVRHSLIGSWRDLVTLAIADNRGRVCPNRDETEQTLALVHMAAEEMGCLDGPYAFPSPQARVRFARERGASRHFDPPAPKGSAVTVLSGMPGVGKSTYAATTLAGVPEVSFDAVRARMRVAHGEREGQVAQAAFEEARVHLRAGTDFVWNATAMTRLDRDRIVDLSLRYDARVAIHALDAPRAEVLARNAARSGAVPLAAIEAFERRWEPVMPDEAHEVVYVDASGPRPRPVASTEAGRDGGEPSGPPGIM